ncbi:hypothetical protein CANINC_002992 [Pichia inconspicua]|uniref:Uncharacterized protein n=1 Tax=Pichia inconspicua TaxID=52247 RepID=A0A4T0WZR2_9ASCO|nr:hypothetical protein CANINC_002992 [[Candida] inconspicua]
MTFTHQDKNFTILVLEPIRYAHDAWKNLENNNPNICIVKSAAKNRSEFIDEIKGNKFSNVDAISHTFQCVKETGLFDREIIDLLATHTKTRCIAHCGAGYDQIDVQACKEFNIEVSNVPNKVSNATADTNVFLILSATRNFQIGHDNMMKGKWEENDMAGGTPIGHSIQGKTVGILGMGGIGKTVRDRLSGFGLKKIIYYNRSRLSSEEERNCEYCSSIEQLCAESDIISINIPLNANTKHIINKELVEKMKDGVVIVNTSRGPVVDESAIKDGLKSGKIFSYGADVWENEPFVDKEILAMPNVVSLPHMGAATLETIKSMEELVVENIHEYYKTGHVLNLVPELQFA